MKFYILCKDEAPNIKKCVESLLACGMEVVVLDFLPSIIAALPVGAEIL